MPPVRPMDDDEPCEPVSSPHASKPATVVPTNTSPTNAASPASRLGPLPTPPRPVPISTPPVPGGTSSPFPTTVAPAPPPPSEVRIEWGHAGVRNLRGRLSDLSGRDGIVRTLAAGVSYTRPPLPRELPSWEATADATQRVEMAWPGDPTQSRCLADLAEDLRRYPPSANDARLAELDAAVAALLELVAHLHERRHGGGLLTPRNIFVLPDSGGRRVVPVDLGFTWATGSPLRPAWLDPNGEYAPLWDAPPTQQQGTPGAPPDVGSDLRTVARLLATVLRGGRPSATVTPPSDGPGRDAPIWGVLTAVMAGQIATAAELADRIGRAPPSRNFYAPPPPVAGADPSVRRRRRVLMVFGLLVLLAAGGGAAYLVLFPPQPSVEPTSTEPDDPKAQLKKIDLPADLPADSALAPLAKQLAEAKPEDAAGLLARMYQTPLSTDPTVKQKELTALATMRASWLTGNWQPRFRRAVLAAQEPTARLDAARGLVDLHRELTGLRRYPISDHHPDAKKHDSEEQQCLEIAAHIAGGLGLAP